LLPTKRKWPLGVKNTYNRMIESSRARQPLTSSVAG
jgi:hypothetical protein